MDIIVLFEYLDKEGLVHIIELENHSGQKAIFSSKNYKYDDVTDIYLLADCTKPYKNEIEILSYNIVSPLLKLKPLLDKYSHAIIYPTSTLENYVNNGYKTEEDIKFEKQCKLTKESIYTAWAIGCVSIILSIIMYCCG